MPCSVGFYEMGNISERYAVLICRTILYLAFRYFFFFIRYQELRCGLARRNVFIDAERRSPFGKFQ